MLCVEIVTVREDFGVRVPSFRERRCSSEAAPVIVERERNCAKPPTGAQAPSKLQALAALVPVTRLLDLPKTLALALLRGVELRVGLVWGWESQRHRHSG